MNIETNQGGNMNTQTALIVAEKIYGAHPYARGVFWSLDQLLRETILLVAIIKEMSLADATMYVQWKLIQ